MFVARAALPDRAARLGRPRRSAAARRPRSWRRSRRALLPALIPFDRFIDDVGGLRHADAAAAAGRSRIDVGLVRGSTTSSCSVRLVVAAVVPVRSAPVRCSRCPSSCSSTSRWRSSRSGTAGPHGVKQAAAGALFQGIRAAQRDWIDRAVPAAPSVAVLWTGRSRPLHRQP